MNEFDEVFEEAMLRFDRWVKRQGIRGQMIMPQDGIEYWVWQVSKEKYEH